MSALKYCVLPPKLYNRGPNHEGQNLSASESSDIMAEINLCYLLTYLTYKSRLSCWNLVYSIFFDIQLKLLYLTTTSA